MLTMMLTTLTTLTMLTMLTPTQSEYTYAVPRTLDSREGTGYHPSLQTSANHLYVASTNLDLGGLLWLTICDLDGRGCTNHDLSLGQGTSSGSRPSLALDTSANKIYIVTSDASSYPRLFLCSLTPSGRLNATSCLTRPISASQSSQSGYLPSLALDIPGGKLIVVAQNTAQNGKPWAYVCDLDGNNCIDTDISAGEGDQSGRDPFLQLDLSSPTQRMYVATTNVARGERPYLTICNIDASACSAHDISATQGDFSGEFPSLALDIPGGSLYVATRNTAQQNRPWLFVCDLTGTACTDVDLSAGAFSGFSPSLALHTPSNSLLIATYNLAQNYHPWLYSCHLSNLSNCTQTDISAQVPVASIDGSIALLLPPGDPRAYVVTTQDVLDPFSLGLRIVSPPVARACPDITLGNGSYTYDLSYPTWFALPLCDAGFGLIGSNARPCDPLSTTWQGTAPSCVANTSDVYFTLTTTQVAAGAPLSLSLTDANGPSGSNPGSSLPSASIIATTTTDDTPTPLSFLYNDGSFILTLTHLPTLAGDYTLVLSLNGMQVGRAPITITPASFAGFVRESTLSAIVGHPASVTIALEDRFGNPFATSPSVADAQPLIAILTFAATGGVTRSDALLPVPRRPETPDFYDARLSFTTTVPGNYTLTASYGVTPVQRSTSISASCGPKLQIVGGVCVPLLCNPDSINVGPVNETVATCVCNTGFTVDRSLPPSLFPVCIPCPDGARCPLGLGAPIALKGFYPVGDGTFVRCKRPSACRGGSPACALGYTGYMCNTCDRGYYSDSAAACKACPAAPGGLFAGALTTLLIVSLALAAGIALGRRRTRKKKGNHDLRSRTYPASLFIVLTACQVIGIFSSANFAWSDSAQQTLNVFNVANIDVNLFASECALASFHLKYAVSIGLPMLLLALALVALLLFKALGLFGLAETRIRTLIDTATFSVAPLVYIPLANAVFVLFDCSKLPSGSWVLDVDPGVPCFDGAWWSVAWLGLFALFGFVLGAPLYFLFCMVQRRHKLMTPVTFARYGTLYNLYRVPFYWAGVAELGKRLLIVVVFTFVSESVLPQIGLLLSIFLSSSFLVHKAQPYFYPLYNNLDFRLTLILIVLLCLGGAAHSERNTSGSSDTVILIGIILTLLVFVALSSHAILVDILQIHRARSNSYSAARDRALRLARVVQHEIDDLESECRDEAHRFVHSLSQPPTHMSVIISDSISGSDSGDGVANV